MRSGSIAWIPCGLNSETRWVQRFTGETPIVVSLAQATEAPMAPSKLRPGLSAEWDAFVLKALSKAKEERYETAQVMRDALPRA